MDFNHEMLHSIYIRYTHMGTMTQSFVAFEKAEGFQFSSDQSFELGSVDARISSKAKQALHGTADMLPCSHL